MKPLTRTVAALATMALPYLAVAFVLLEFNPTAWDESGRFSMVLLEAVAVSIALVIVTGK